MMPQVPEDAAKEQGTPRPQGWPIRGRQATGFAGSVRVPTSGHAGQPLGATSCTLLHSQLPALHAGVHGFGEHHWPYCRRCLGDATPKARRLAVFLSHRNLDPGSKPTVLDISVPTLSLICSVKPLVTAPRLLTGCSLGRLRIQADRCCNDLSLISLRSVDGSNRPRTLSLRPCPGCPNSVSACTTLCPQPELLHLLLCFSLPRRQGSGFQHTLQKHKGSSSNPALPLGSL